MREERRTCPLLHVHHLGKATASSDYLHGKLLARKEVLFSQRVKDLSF